MFDLYTGTVAPASLPLVDSVARRLQRCADLQVEIEVHTDTFRASEFNARQSQRVAETLRDRLVADGVATTRLAACGYGESRPITQALTFPERNANQRIEWHLLTTAAAAFTCPPIPP